MRSAAAEVPIVDVSRLETDSRALARLERACRDWGFFQIVGHGIDRPRTDATLEAMRAFFALPVEDKRAVERTAENPWGYYDRELTKQARDWKQIFDFGLPDETGLYPRARPQWPALDGFEEEMWAFFRVCEALSFRLLSGISRTLGAPADRLHGDFAQHHTSFLRLNYYPQCDESEQHLGVHQHTDAGAVTVLLQDEHPGLEVLREDRWRPVEPRAGALVVNVGDVVQVWSNDRYPAPVHRVRASAEYGRYSAPFFFNPAYAASYAPLPGTGTPRYRPINWGEFRAGRSAGDYADLGAEIQIEQFRI